MAEDEEDPAWGDVDVETLKTETKTGASTSTSEKTPANDKQKVNN